MKKSILILFLVLALAIPSAVLAAGAADEKTFVYATYGDVKDLGSLDSIFIGGLFVPTGL